MSKNKFDVVVIGSGPGGYVCAIRLAQLGFKTAIIEKYNSLGGTCLNVGCIPSKSLLDSSHHYDDVLKNIVNHGIEIDGEIKLNFSKMIERKNSVVNQTVKGIDYLMDKNKISVFYGKAKFIDNNTKEEVTEFPSVTMKIDTEPKNKTTKIETIENLIKETNKESLLEQKEEEEKEEKDDESNSSEVKKSIKIDN